MIYLLRLPKKKKKKRERDWNGVSHSVNNCNPLIFNYKVFFLIFLKKLRPRVLLSRECTQIQKIKIKTLELRDKHINNKIKRPYEQRPTNWRKRRWETDVREWRWILKFAEKNYSFLSVLCLAAVKRFPENTYFPEMLISGKGKHFCVFGCISKNFPKNIF